jgi:hypothetical protein
VVGVNVVPLMATLLALAVGSVGRLLALALDRPRVIIEGAALELAAFWAIGFPLASRAGSFGACLATLPASAIYAWYVAARMRPHLAYPLRVPARALLLAAVFLPLGLLQGPWALGLLGFAAGAAADAGRLVGTRTI